MSRVQAMLRTHPQQNELDAEALITCIDACFECAQSCTACADACLGEPEVAELVECIRLNLDCADVCKVTGQMLMRQTMPSFELWHSQLYACSLACQVCGAMCEHHADMHEHCRICAEACRECEMACQQLMHIAMPASVALN